MCGTTNPLDALPGTIRADFASSLDHNVIHAADCEEAAEMEILLFFDENELHAGACPTPSFV